MHWCLIVLQREASVDVNLNIIYKVQWNDSLADISMTLMELQLRSRSYFLRFFLFARSISIPP